MLATKSAPIWRTLIRTDVLAICAVVFLADVIMGMIFATFSLFATSLGASVALVGLLTSFMGLISIGSAVPIGILSDQVGRRRVITGGMLLFALANLLYTLAPNPYWLFPARFFMAIGAIAVFMMGMAYLGDVVSDQERGLAVGLFSTSMGLGFTVGPALSGLLVAAAGYQLAYQVAAVLALVGCGIALGGLAKPATRTAASTQAVPLVAQLRLLLRNRNLLAASVGTLTNSLAFSSLFAFFPLYAVAQGRADVAIGALLAGRALASTVTRIPTGLLATRFSNRWLMMVALLLTTLVHLMLIWPPLATSWTLLLMVDGIAYGMFLVAGQSFVTKHATAAERGTAIGLYGMAGGIGSTLGPLLLGGLAAAWGVAVVFPATAVLVMGGIGVVFGLRVPRNATLLQ